MLKKEDYKLFFFMSKCKNILNHQKELGTNKPIPFAPNSLENAKRGCHLSLLTVFTHKGSLPREDSLPNSVRENPANPKNN